MAAVDAEQRREHSAELRPEFKVVRREQHLHFLLLPARRKSQPEQARLQANAGQVEADAVRRRMRHLRYKTRAT